MADKQPTIGLTALLDEINHDLDELRKKHPNDYSLKNLDMWWDLERDRVTTRHGPYSVVRKLQRAQSVRWTLSLFTAGWLTMMVIQTALRLLLP